MSRSAPKLAFGAGLEFLYFLDVLFCAFGRVLLQCPRGRVLANPDPCGKEPCLSAKPAIGGYANFPPFFMCAFLCSVPERMDRREAKLRRIEARRAAKSAA